MWINGVVGYIYIYPYDLGIRVLGLLGLRV